MATTTTGKTHEYYRWVTRGEIDCPLCARLDGEIMTREEWSRTILPGFHEGCDCTLVLDHIEEEYFPSDNILMKLDADRLSELKESIANILQQADSFFAYITGRRRFCRANDADPLIEGHHPYNPGGGSVNPGGSIPGIPAGRPSSPGSIPGSFRPQR